MAGIETYKIPKFEYFQDEGNYVSPAEVSTETIDRIKARKIGNKILGL